VGANALFKKAKDLKTVKNKQEAYRIIQIFHAITENNKTPNIANINYILLYILNKLV